MGLLAELYVVFTEHRQCGELDAGVEKPVVWIGASMVGPVVKSANAPSVLVPSNSP